MDNLPPLSALRVFESVARQLSFTAAARDLGMTQAGVSYQIKLLEERLGGPLFLRKPKGIELTALGKRLAKPTHDAFDLLRSAYAPTQHSDTLTVSTLPTLAGNWLSQRLSRFQIDNPGISVKMESSEHLVDFSREDVDVAIRMSRDPTLPGITAHRLFELRFTPMLSPALAQRFPPLRDPADIMPLPWLDPHDPSWEVWLGEAGLKITCEIARAALTLGTQIHEARAAMAGEGVAMLTPRFFKFELETGLLVQPFETQATNGSAYWLVYPTARRNRPAIRAFRKFILAEAAADG